MKVWFELTAESHRPHYKVTVHRDEDWPTTPYWTASDRYGRSSEHRRVSYRRMTIVGAKARGQRALRRAQRERKRINHVRSQVIRHNHALLTNGDSHE